MNKTLIIGIVAFPALLLAAEPKPAVPQLPAPKSVQPAGTGTNKAINLQSLSREERRALMMRYEGGRIAKPGSNQGKITYVNAQKRIPKEWLVDSGKLFNAVFRGKICYDIEVKEGAFTLPSPKLESEATLFVIDDPAMPTLLSAPENRWVMVNMHNIEEGDGAKPAFLEARAKKRMQRGVAILAGAQDSTYPRCLLTCMTKPEQMDVNPDCRLPVDVIKRFEKYLLGYGIKPAAIKTYRQACEEGWAPKPANDIQKAIWDEIHTIPTKPIKIEFDPKTDK